jgi:hypothetical protein
MRFSVLVKLGRELSTALKCRGFLQEQGRAFPAIWANLPAFTQIAGRDGLAQTPAQPPSRVSSGSLQKPTKTLLKKPVLRMALSGHHPQNCAGIHQSAYSGLLS